MKNLLQLTLISLIFGCIFYSCDKEEDKVRFLPNPLVFQSQTEIDRHAHLLEELTTFDGDIRITPFLSKNALDVVDLSALKNIEQVTGVFYISGSGLKNLEDLTALRSIGALIISGNDSIKSVCLDQLKKVTGNLIIQRNSSLEHICFPSLQSVGLDVSVIDNPSLSTWDDTPLLERVGSLNIGSDENSFSIIDGWGSLRQVDRGIAIDFDHMSVSEFTTSELQVTDGPVGIRIENGYDNLDWLSAIKKANYIGFTAPFSAEEVCLFKTYVLEYPAPQNHFHSTLLSRTYFNSDVIDNCQ